MQNNVDIAVLLIAFNRPDTTSKVFECIRSARPPRLYIAADGPRANNENDLIGCHAVRAFKDKVDWNCSVKTLYSERNQGCKNGVVSAINWFFENEDEGIILEDDIIPSTAFFSYAALMIERYRSSSNVKAVLGFNYHGQRVKSDSYFFYEGFYPWGWATWRRTWMEYSVSNFDTRSLAKKRIERSTHRHLYNSLELNLDLIEEGILDTWDYQFMYMLVMTGGLTIAPYSNLTKNIGSNGAHSVNNALYFEYGLLDANKITHPLGIEVDKKMNELFLLEYESNRHTILLKKWLLKMSLYKMLKALRKKYLEMA